MAKAKDINRDVGSHEGERLRDEGMDRAAKRKRRRIWRAQLRLLKAVLRSPDRVATTDDACHDLGCQYRDGGRWRGSVPVELARKHLIRKVGVVASARPSRHAGYVAQWQGIDDDAIVTYCRLLRRRLEAIESQDNVPV